MRTAGARLYRRAPAYARAKRRRGAARMTADGEAGDNAALACAVPAASRTTTTFYVAVNGSDTHDANARG